MQKKAPVTHSQPLIPSSGGISGACVLEAVWSDASSSRIDIVVIDMAESCEKGCEILYKEWDKQTYALIEWETGLQIRLGQTV